MDFRGVMAISFEIPLFFDSPCIQYLQSWDSVYPVPSAQSRCRLCAGMLMVILILHWAPLAPAPWPSLATLSSTQTRSKSCTVCKYINCTTLCILNLKQWHLVNNNYSWHISWLRLLNTSQYIICMTRQEVYLYLYIICTI